MLHKNIMWILWPSFLMAGILEILVFGLLDPNDINWFGQPLNLSHAGIYTLGFFCFWLITTFSSALSIFLAKPYID